MKKYERPALDVVQDVSENVYMASGSSSGSGDCWTVSGRSVQEWNGSYHVFEISARHSTEVEHITTHVTYVITFSDQLKDANSEFPATFSGNKVTVERDLHANGYKSGDSVTFKVWAMAADEATTKALSLTSASYSCTHSENVQGKID